MALEQQSSASAFTITFTSESGFSFDCSLLLFIADDDASSVVVAEFVLSKNL